MSAQDLTPRAYVIAPVGSNAVTLAYSFSDGAVLTDTTLPITDFTARFHAQVLSYFRAFSFLGRSTNAVVSVPYAFGTLRATVGDREGQLYRSGLADFRLRFAVNLRGAPAMPLRKFTEWREKASLGASLTVVAPTGQYDPARLINSGSNRWAAKPELGFSKRFSNWTVDLYGGIWFFADNSKFFPGTSTRQQDPVGAVELHLTRYLNRRFWLSADGNYWTGGRTTIGESRKADYQKNSRVGITVSVPVSQHFSLKGSYSRGAYISIGGNYQNLTLAWQYSWITGAR